MNDTAADTAPEIVQGETLEQLALQVQDAPPDDLPPDAPPPSAATVQMLEIAWFTLLKVLAPNWLKVSEENRAELTAAGIETDTAAHTLALGFAPLAEKYFPDNVITGPWGQAGMAAVTVFAPLAGVPLRLPEKKPAPPKQEAAPDAAGNG